MMAWWPGKHSLCSKIRKIVAYVSLGDPKPCSCLSAEGSKAHSTHIDEQCSDLVARARVD
jgi:hypothetical protein